MTPTPITPADGGARADGLRRLVEMRTDALEYAIDVLKDIAKDQDWLDDDEYMSVPSVLTVLRGARFCDADGRSMINHSHNLDGSPRAEHCCGCFDFDPEMRLARCNECGEEHHAYVVLRRAEADVERARSARARGGSGNG